MNTTRPLDAYQYSHILLPSFRISNLIRLPTSTSDKPPYPTHNECKSQSLEQTAATTPTVKTVSFAATPQSSSATTRPASAASSGIGGPNPRTNPKGKTIYSTPIKTYYPVYKDHEGFIDTIVHLIIRTTVRSATLQLFNALMSARSVSLLSPLLVQPLVRPITAVPALSLAKSRPIACNFIPSSRVEKDADMR